MICVGFSTTNMVLSRFIRWVTGSTTSHAWLLFDFHGIPMVFEATFEGVRLIPLEVFKKSNDIVVIYQTPCGEETLKPIFHKLGQNYDFGGLLGSAVVQLGRRFRRRWNNPWNNGKALFCSEIVAEWLRDVGYPGAENLASAEVSPQDLLKLFSGE